MKTYIAIGSLERDMTVIIGAFSSKAKANQALQDYIVAQGGPPWDGWIETVKVDTVADISI